MHGDDVASAGVEVTTQIVSKATELFMEMLKIAIEREREKNRFSEKSDVLSGGEVTYQRLKEGGEVTMLPSFAKEDYGEFLKQAKKMDIPVAAIREQGKDNTLSVFFNVKDKEAVNSIVQGIVREKMKAPEQTERMITIEKEQVEGFQAYCSEHDIPVNFMETQSDVKCIFNSAYEKQIAAAIENYRQVQNELSKAEIKVQADERGRPQIIVSDTELGKRLSMNFCTKAKLERVLQERLGFSKVKALEAASVLLKQLSSEQKKYFLSGSRQLEQMEFYQKDIKFENENVLADKFSFAKLKLPDEDFSRLTITDKSGNFVVLSEKNIDREQVEKSIRAHLKLDDTETVKAILEKAERLGFAEKPKLTQFREYQIERENTLFQMRTNDDNYVLSGTSKLVEPRTMQYRFKNILKRLNLPQVNFHSLRHMFATRCVALGIDVKTLSEILGHSSVKITLDRYVHSSMERKQSCMKLFSDNVLAA